MQHEKGSWLPSPHHKTEGNETDKLIRTLSRLPYEFQYQSSPEDTSVEISTSKILEMLLTLPLWPRARCLLSVVMPTWLTTKPLLPPSLLIARGKEADALASFSRVPFSSESGLSTVTKPHSCEKILSLAAILRAKGHAK